MATCLHCGVEFEAQRSTAKYCSDNHRVEYHREKERKQREFEQHSEAMWSAMRYFSDLSYDSTYSYKSTVELLGARSMANFYVPSLSWWHCRKCNKKFHVEMPDKNCGCDKPDWKRLDTSG